MSSKGRAAIVLGSRRVESRCLYLGALGSLGLLLCGLNLLAAFDHQGDCRDGVVVLEVHDAYASSRTPLAGDAASGGALNHAADGDEDELLVLAHDERPSESALLLGEANGLDAFGA